MSTYTCIHIYDLKGKGGKKKNLFLQKIIRIKDNTGSMYVNHTDKIHSDPLFYVAKVLDGFSNCSTLTFNLKLKNKYLNPSQLR